MDTWTMIERGRETLGDYLGGLEPDQWSCASLCEGWTATDVAAHLLVVPTMSKTRVFRSFFGSGFDLARMNARFVAQLTAAMSTSEITSAIRASAGSRSVPPGLKLPGVLTELVVHSLDIAEAIGIPCALPVEDHIAVLDHLKHVKPVFRSAQRIAGLTLRATDADWSTGSGPAVEGSIGHLVLAVAGRPSALDHLAGEGVATLRLR